MQYIDKISFDTGSPYTAIKTWDCYQQKKCYNIGFLQQYSSTFEFFLDQEGCYYNFSSNYFGSLATDHVSLDLNTNNVVSDFVFIAAKDGSNYYDNGILGLAAGEYFTSLIFSLY